MMNSSEDTRAGRVPRAGELWMVENEGACRILNVSRRAESDQILITYQAIDDTEILSRTLESWKSSGRKLRNCTKCGGEGVVQDVFRSRSGMALNTSYRCKACGGAGYQREGGENSM